MERIPEKLKKIVEIIREKKGENTVILDLRELTWITDYFVITGGSSLIQTKVIAETLLEKIDEQPISVEGYEYGKWILMDYGDVIVHIFLNEIREFYRLEKLWGDAKTIEI